MSTPTVDAFSAVNATSAAAPPATKNDAGSADRFLKLLVTQLKNQDPLNPMDNAQITSQMAQINTVSGIDKLNTTVASLGTQMLQSQALQGAALVGHDVTIVGDGLSISGGVGVAGFELAACRTPWSSAPRAPADTASNGRRPASPTAATTTSA
jgi:flagellar basal-body rod modification protein FlgD